jgi:hypothetical protein
VSPIGDAHSFPSSPDQSRDSAISTAICGIICAA